MAGFSIHNVQKIKIDSVYDLEPNYSLTLLVTEKDHISGKNITHEIKLFAEDIAQLTLPQGKLTPTR